MPWLGNLVSRLSDAWLILGPALLAALVLALDAIPVNAGVKLLPPPQAKDPAASNEEDFPQSRFGQAPDRKIPGLPNRFVVREMEETDPVTAMTDEEGGSHSPGSPVAYQAPGPRPDAASRATGRSPASVGAAANAASAQPQTPSARDEAAPPPQADLPVRTTRSQALRDSLPSDVETQAAVRRKGVQEIALIAGDLGFFPKTFFVSRDVPVRLFVTGASKSSLCIMMDSFGVRKQVRSQKIEEITFTASTPGRYRYYCPVNGSEGLMIVKELTTSAPATE